jgi:short-subunit dehydrogenase
MKLDGATTLLTGASGGLGRAIARRLAAEGARLVLSGRRRDALEALAADVGARAIVADLAHAADVERLAAEADPVDVLVANAGLPATGNALDATPHDVDRVLAVNLRAPIVLSQILARSMVARGRGHVVLMGSIAGLVSSPGGSLYSATKFGLRGFAQGFRADLHGKGVGVSIVMPGFVRDAGMFADSGVKLPPGVRTSSPEEVADAVVAAIEGDVGETVVAPIEMRLLSTAASLAPAWSAALQRLAGADRLSAEAARGQRRKR